MHHSRVKRHTNFHSYETVQLYIRIVSEPNIALCVSKPAVILLSVEIQVMVYDAMRLLCLLAGLKMEVFQRLE